MKYNEVYIGQTYAPLKLISGVDLTSASTIEILWQNPSGVKGKWTTGITAVQEPDENTKLPVWKVQYNFGADDVKIPGTWKVQIRAVISGKEALGQEDFFIAKSSLK